MANELDKERRERYLRNLITEGVVNVLAEMDMMHQEQEQPVSAAPPTTPGPAPETNTADPDITNREVPPEQKVFDVDEMVDKLNVLRGSRSFTDPEVYGRLNTFFNNLTEEQKNSIDWLLTELGKIVIDASEQQVDPGMQQTTSQSPPPAQNPQQSVQQAPTQAPTGAAPVTPTGV